MSSLPGYCQLSREDFGNDGLQTAFTCTVGVFLISFFSLLIFGRAYAATITVNSTADTGGTGICVLRDAITAANTETATNGCVKGTGTDTINFSVSGTITLGSTLPIIDNMTPNSLTIDGSGQNITISGQKAATVMAVKQGATLNLKNLTIADGFNPAVGGGILSSGTLTITNSTFSGNSASATQGGGGIANTFTANLKGTIVAASTSGGNCATASGAVSVTDQGYNISDDTTCGFSKTGSANNGDEVNPLLSTAGLANNGGPTQTTALLQGSPAIDAIPVADCTDQASPPNPITTDQRGFPRPDPGEVVCDIGAYEFQDTLAFAKFQAALDVNKPDEFLVLGSFVPAAGATINPVTQALTLASTGLAQPASLTLAAGSFKLVRGLYVFAGKVNGVEVAATITPLGKNTYGYLIGADGLELAGIANPVTVSLQLGNNLGTTSVQAHIQ